MIANDEGEPEHPCVMLADCGRDWSVHVSIF